MAASLEPATAFQEATSRAQTAFAAEELRNLIDIGADWLWETDGNHRFTWLSESFESVSGVSPPAVLGRSRFENLEAVAESSKNAADHLADLQAHRPFRDFVYAPVQAAEKCRWVSISGVPRFDEAGEFIGYRGLGRNVTGILAAVDELDAARGEIRRKEERERALEHAARSSESHAERLMAALNVMEDAFCYYDKDDRLVFHNLAMPDMYRGLKDLIRPGVAFPDLLDAGIERDLWALDGMDGAEWKTQALQTRYGEDQSQTTIRFNDGRWVMRRDMRTAEGGTMGICTDITELKRHEAKVEGARAGAEAAQQRLQAAIDALSDGFVLWDSDDRLVACNEAYQKQYSCLTRLEPGCNFGDLLLEYARSGAVQAAVGREEEWVAEQAACRADEFGKEILFQTQDARWMMRRDQLTATGDRVGVRTNVTELKRHEAKVEKARADAEAAQQRLQAAIDALSDGFVLWDSDDRLVACNDAFRSQFAFLKGLDNGRTYRELFVDFARTGVVAEAVGREEEWVDEHVASRAQELDKEIVFQTHDGRWRMRRDRLTATGDRVGIRTDVTEIKKRESELARAHDQSEQLRFDLERTLDSLKMGVVLFDADMNALILNREYYDIWKQTPADAPVGSSFRSLMEMNRHRGVYNVADDYWEDYVASRAAEIKAGDVAPREFRRADGCTMIYAVTSLSGGKRLVSYFDITDMKKREADLAAALERSKLADAVINGVRDPIFVKDAELKFVFVNRAFAAIFGVEPCAMIGKKDSDFLDPEEVSKFEESERRVLATGQSYETEDDFEFAGASRNGIVRKDRISTAAGKDYLSCFVFDITDMRRREVEAEEARQRLADVLESLPAGVIIYDRDDRFVHANRKMHEIANPGMGSAMHPGLPLRAAMEAAHDSGCFRDSGDAALDALYDSDREAWIEGYMRRYHVKQAVFERSNPDGRWYQVFDTRIPDGSFVGVRVDITELKERAAELEQARRQAVLADRAKSEFLANMSHEIRTPMNGVLGMAELLSRSDLDAKQKTFTDIIMKSGNALLTIINDILDFSKIDAGQLVLDPAPFNLTEAIEDVATLVSTRAKEKDLELVVRVEPGLPEVFTGDPGRIRQIITNLLGNAVKFTDAGHVLVEVTGESHDGATKLRVSVTDTGIGVPREKLGLVFEKFSQADTSSTRRHEGTGLGLAITSRLVALMGGEVGVESVEGEGSTFWFAITLPNAPAQDRRKTTPVDVTGSRVLIIDDNSVNRAILTEQMTAWGFDSCAAQDGGEGLKVLLAAAGHGIGVDCVILDYQMPGITGAEVAAAMRANEALAHVPIVMLTSVDQSLSNKRYRDLGIDAHLIKPARSSALLEAVVSTIQRKRGYSSLAPAPAAAEAPKPAAAPETGKKMTFSPAAAPAGGLDILVAEDNEVNQLVFQQILADSPYSFEIAVNGRLAVEAFKNRMPRMVLMDVSMPEMNGLEATGAIREFEAGSSGRTPIVGVTAHALKGDRERCIASGMDDYLSKPISPNALMQKVERWIGEGDGEAVAEAG